MSYALVVQNIARITMARATATNRYPVLPVCRVTSLALLFVIKHWSTGLYRDAMFGFLALSTPCRQRTNKSQGQRQTGGRTGSSIQDQMLRLPGFLHWWNQQNPKHATDRTQTSNEEWWRQQSHCRAPFTDETSNWLGLCDMFYVFYYQRLALESWFTNSEKNATDSQSTVTDTVQTTHWRTQAKLTTREWLDNRQFDQRTTTLLTVTIDRSKRTNKITSLYSQ